MTTEFLLFIIIIYLVILNNCFFPIATYYLSYENPTCMWLINYILVVKSLSLVSVLSVFHVIITYKYYII